MQYDTSDRDWLFPDEPPSQAELAAAAVASDPTFRRTDMPRVKFSTLIAAVAEPPLEPEALVVDAANRCHAHASDAESDRARWIATATGRIQLEAEANGRRAA
jgi:hypothetical protein